MNKKNKPKMGKVSMAISRRRSGDVGQSRNKTRQKVGRLVVLVVPIHILTPQEALYRILLRIESVFLPEK